MNMDLNSPDIFGMMAGFGILIAVIWFVVTVLLILLAIWIQYTIMWRAVRRGMREFHYGSSAGPPQVQVQPTQQQVPPAAPPTQ